MRSPFSFILLVSLTVFATLVPTAVWSDESAEAESAETKDEEAKSEKTATTDQIAKSSDEEDDESDSSDKSSDKKKKDSKYKPYSEVLKDAKEIEGLITLHRKDDKLFAELKASQFDSDYIVLITIARGIGQTPLVGGFS